MIQKKSFGVVTVPTFSTIEPCMTLCVEGFIGQQAGGEGVKLEEQVYGSEDGVELFSDCPFDDRLLGRAA